MFGDNMVLQRGKPNTIWGWSKPGEEIRVTVANHTVKTLTKERRPLVRRNRATRAGRALHRRHGRTATR